MIKVTFLAVARGVFWTKSRAYEVDVSVPGRRRRVERREWQTIIRNECFYVPVFLGRGRIAIVMVPSDEDVGEVWIAKPVLNVGFDKVAPVSLVSSWRVTPRRAIIADVSEG